MESRKGRDAVVQHALLPSHSPLEKTPHKIRIVDEALLLSSAGATGMPICARSISHMNLEN